MTPMLCRPCQTNGRTRLSDDSGRILDVSLVAETPQCDGLAPQRTHIGMRGGLRARHRPVYFLYSSQSRADLAS